MDLTHACGERAYHSVYFKKRKKKKKGVGGWGWEVMYIQHAEIKGYLHVSRFFFLLLSSIQHSDADEVIVSSEFQNHSLNCTYTIQYNSFFISNLDRVA